MSDEQPKRSKRVTLNSPGRRLFAASVPLLSALAVALHAQVESCNAKHAAAQAQKTATATAVKQGEHEKVVPKVEQEVKQADKELDAAYKELSASVKVIADKLVWMEKRQDTLEALARATTPTFIRKKFPRPKKPAGAKKPIPQPPASPAAAAVKADLEQLEQKQ